jgi:hypothetical protein
VNIEMRYNTERLRSEFASIENKPLFIMGNETSWLPVTARPRRRVSAGHEFQTFGYPT